MTEQTSLSKGVPTDPLPPEVDVDDYLREVADDPNQLTVDRRQWTVTECRDRVADLIGYER